MRTQNIDRSWLDGAEEEVSSDLRTREILERSIDHRQRRAKEEIRQAKVRQREIRSQEFRMEQHYTASYWAKLLDFKEDTIRGWITLSGVVKDFIERASSHIASIENGDIDPEKP